MCFKCFGAYDFYLFSALLTFCNFFLLHYVKHKNIKNIQNFFFSYYEQQSYTFWQCNILFKECFFLCCWYCVLIWRKGSEGHKWSIKCVLLTANANIESRMKASAGQFWKSPNILFLRSEVTNLFETWHLYVAVIVPNLDAAFGENVDMTV